MKKILFVLLLILLLTGCKTSPVSGKDICYIGSIKSNKYHYQWCVWAKKISPYNAVFFGNTAEALRKGYVPCRVCKPPTKDKQ